MISNPSLRKAKIDGMSYEKRFELFCNSKDVGSIYHSRWSKSGTGSFDDNNKILVKEFPYESIYPGSICKTEFVLILNDRRIRVSKRNKLKSCLFSIYDENKLNNKQPVINFFEKINLLSYQSSSVTRSFGSLALVFLHTNP